MGQQRRVSEAERERNRIRERARYRALRARLLLDPAALAAFRDEANERVRRFRERHADTLAARRRERENARYRADPAYRNRQIARQRDYTERNRDLVYERNRRYYERKRDEISAHRKARRRADPEPLRAKERERNRAEYEADREGVLRYNREWRKRNPEKARLYVRVSSHKRRAAAGSAHWAREEWLALLERYGGRCHYCGAEGRMDADHRIPLSRGGSNMIDNIVPACKSCNCSKNDRTEEEFWAYLAERGRPRRKPA